MASPRQKSSGLQTWFTWVFEWVKGFVRKLGRQGEKELITIEIIRAHSGKAVAESVQRTTPGAVATWYIRHNDHPNARLIVMVDNLRELQKFIDDSIPTDRYIRTHIISIQWLILIGKNRKAIYKFSGAWAGDLQGDTGSINSKAFDVVRYLTIEILNLPTIPSMNWRYRVENYPWEDTIASKCKLLGGTHNARLIRIKEIKLKAQGGSSKK